MTKDVSERLMQSLEEINEKLEHLNLRLIKIERKNEAEHNDLQKIRQALEIFNRKWPADSN